MEVTPHFCSGLTLKGMGLFTLQLNFTTQVQGMFAYETKLET